MSPQTKYYTLESRSDRLQMLYINRYSIDVGYQLI